MTGTEDTTPAPEFSYSPGVTVHYHAPWNNGAQVPYTLTAEDYAVILEATPECDAPGCVQDIAQNWDTAESMILESGARVVALDPANQSGLDVVLEQYRDCWGVE